MFLSGVTTLCSTVSDESRDTQFGILLAIFFPGDASYLSPGLKLGFKLELLQQEIAANCLVPGVN